MKPNYNLLTQRRFLPLFITQFLGGFNDNFLRAALGVLVSYKIASASALGFAPAVVIQIAGLLLVLPYILFSSTAGQLADKFERAKLMRITKYLELFITILAAYAFWNNNVYLLLGLVFLIGVQSTFFSPMKYSVLPDHLKKNELVTGNGYIEGGTFIAVLVGTILGTQFGDFLDLDNPENSILIGGTLVMMSLFGIASSRFIPKAPIAHADLKIDKNPLTATYGIIKNIRRNPLVFHAILGTSWFWLLGIIFQSNFISYAREVVYVDANVTTIFYATFSVGIAIGAFSAAKLLKGEISARFAPLALLGISFATFGLIAATGLVEPPSVAFMAAENILRGTDGTAFLTPALRELVNNSLYTPSEFLSQAAGIGVIASVFLIAFCAGIYTVPLKAIIQHNAEEKSRSQIIAGDNIMNALFMVLGGGAVAVLLNIGFDIITVFAVLGIINLVVALFAVVMLPEALLVGIIKSLMKIMFRVEIHGLKHYHDAGERVVILPNHQSFLDPLLLSVFLPRKPDFAINTQIAALWYIKPFLFLCNVFRVDPTNPMSMKSLIEYVSNNKKVVIFPEGRITTTGSLMKVYEGSGLVADKADAMILPIRIEGAQYSKLSRLKGKVRRRLFPKIVITIAPPFKLELKDGSAKERRAQIAAKLERMMSEVMFESTKYKRALLASLLESAEIHGNKRVVLEDISRKTMNYKQLLLKIFVLGRALKKRVKGHNVGVLLPNSLANVVTFFALHSISRTPAMINFSAGVKNVNSACKTAEIKCLITSRLFVDKAELAPLIEGIKNVEILYLEDIAKRIGIFSKLRGLAISEFPKYAFRNALKAHYNNPAVILFTSGSEGVPKGVVLSHANIQANIAQADSVVDFSSRDIVLNVLPMFHSFGLTVGTLLPVTRGIRVFLYPSPLHYSIIPEISYDIDATILFGTDTFLARYAEAADPYDFFSMRYVFAGAEKLKDSTYQLWQDKFGIRILQGYGVTETSPFLSANTPMQNRRGSVGRIIPGVEYEIRDVEGIEEGGELWVKGPNIMLGYMKEDKPGKLQPAEKGWHNTGDIVRIDDDGFLYILGRAKRFAKIAGEMVSLPAVEEVLSKLWEKNTLVVAVSDEKKGEQLVIVTEQAGARLEDAKAALKESGFPGVATPRQLVEMEIPLLGSGKTDFAALQKKVEEWLASSF